MTLTDVLLLTLIVTILFAVFSGRKQSRETNKVNREIANAQEKKQEDERPEIMVLNVRPPKNNKPSPQIDKYEKELDALYYNREFNKKLTGTEWEKQEGIIISNLVNAFIQEADTKLTHEPTQHISGSK